MADGAIASTDARKIVGIDSTDGLALVSYAGLGMISGLDPSDWVTSVCQGVQTDLRGYMMCLAEAMKEVDPVERSAAPGHLFVAAGVVDGQPVLYSLVAGSAGRLSLRYFERPNTFMIAGAGRASLQNTDDKLTDEAHELRDWIRKVETEDAHPREVTDRLAKWDAATSRETENAGSRAIVAYRLVGDGEVAPGRCFYDGATLEPPDSKIPQMTRGVDVNQIFDLMKKQAMGGVLSPKETALLAAYKNAEANG